MVDSHEPGPGKLKIEIIDLEQLQLAVSGPVQIVSSQIRALLIWKISSARYIFFVKVIKFKIYQFLFIVVKWRRGDE